MSSYLKLTGQNDGIRAQCHWPDYPVAGAQSLVMTAFVRFLSWPASVSPVMASETGQNSTGIFVGGTNTRVAVVSATYTCKAFGFDFQQTIAANGTDGSGAPFYLGRIYKLALAIEVQAGAGGTYAKLYCDGTLIGSGFFPYPLEDHAGQTVLDIGGTSAYKGTTTAPPRSAHMEVIQAMYELNRSAASLFPPHSDTDPFTDLELHASADATKSSRWLLNDGSGTTATDEEGVSDMSAGPTFPDWAPAAEPSFPAPGTARYAFESIEGWDLRTGDAPTLCPAPVYGPEGPVGDNTSGVLRLARVGDWKVSDGELVAGLWSPTTQLAASATHKFDGNKALRADGASLISNWAPLTSAGTKTEHWLSWWFYDPGGTTSTRSQMFGFSTSGPTLLFGTGFDGATSTTKYTTHCNGATTPAQASSVDVSTGWHSFAVYVNYSTNTVKYYIDGALVRTETSATLAESSTVRLVIVQRGVSASSDDGYYDGIRAGVAGDAAAAIATYEGLVEATGSTILPLLQPAEGVSFFRSVAVTDENAGTSPMDIGDAPTYTFRHSTNGGSSWGSSTPLTEANLRALACAGNGQDVLEITVELASGMDDMSSPAVSQIQLEYEPAAALGEPREVFETFDHFTLGEDARNG